MTTRDFAPRFANGGRTLPQGAQRLLFFLTKDGGQQSQRPKSQPGRGAHDLRVIQASFLFAISEEDLDVPACREIGEQRLRVCLQVSRGPGPRLGTRGIQGMAHDHDLAARELAPTARHDMRVDRLAAAWPAR